jgi:hypothetical protein
MGVGGEEANKAVHQGAQCGGVVKEAWMAEEALDHLQVLKHKNGGAAVPPGGPSRRAPPHRTRPTPAPACAARGLSCTGMRQSCQRGPALLPLLRHRRFGLVKAAQLAGNELYLFLDTCPP